MDNKYKTRTEIRNGKSIKVAEANKKQGLWNNDNAYLTVANDAIGIPVWQKAALTIEEAAKYSNISSKTLRRFINENAPDFILKIGTKTLIKRRIFERFLERTDAI